MTRRSGSWACSASQAVSTRGRTKASLAKLAVAARKGTLTVICGPMFSNKSGELLRLATVHRIAGRAATLFKHSLDDRYQGVDAISTNGGVSMEAERVA